MFLKTSAKYLRNSALILGFGFVGAQALAAGSGGYDLPPKEILDIMRTPSAPSPYISPTRDRILLVSMEDYPSIESVATPFLRLAGVRVEPKNHSKHDTQGGYGITPCVSQLAIVKVADGSQIAVDMSKTKCPAMPLWSYDGKHFAFTNKTADTVELWVGDGQTGKLTRINGVKLNPMFEDEMQWMPDAKTLLVKAIPKNLGAVPKAPVAPMGPSIQEASGEKGQSSTYEKRDTLNNKYDEQLFDYYGVSQLALVNISNSTVTPVGEPALYEDLKPSPDNMHLLVNKIVKPYSYLVTYERFPKQISVWDLSKSTKPVSHLIANLPLADRVPVHGVPLGVRSVDWRSTAPATLVWAEALDGGDWNIKVPNRDKVMTLSAPFDGPPDEIFRTEQRYNGFDWFESKDKALLGQYDENKHWMKTFLVNADNPQQEQKLIWSLSYDEKYANPGTPVHRVLPNGYRVIRQHGNSFFLAGTGASTIGDRPFLDRMDLNTLKTERLFRSDKSELERFLVFPDEAENKFMTWHQSPSDPPNVFLRQLGDSVSAPAAGEALFESKATPVTHIPDPTPQVRDIKQRLVKYKRGDGLELSFTLFTPPGYKEGTRVPTILYAYPLDFADAATAGQVTGSQAMFTRLRNYKLLLMAGYAIIDRAAFPIVGDPKKAYDNYMEQLVADAKAAVDEAVRLGVADPERIGVTGHSHGALMTANLIAHSNLFRAGVATSGSYNKTLTSFGFQSERRSVWEAPEVYQKVSPFFFADKIKTPLLIIHGSEDANPGTTPLQANLLYEALRGNGGTTRLVMLPNEPHWYTALESNEQLIYEMLTWFDKYVKNADVSKARK